MKFEDLDEGTLDYVENKEAEDEIVEPALIFTNEETPVVKDTPTTAEDETVEPATTAEIEEDTPVAEDILTTVEDEIVESAPTVEIEDEVEEDSTGGSEKEDEYEPKQDENNVEVIVFTFQDYGYNTIYRESYFVLKISLY